MSRTRHHTKVNETIRAKRKKLIEFKQKHLKSLSLEDWYIELPVSKQFSSSTMLTRK
jgi:hypothetical protein